MKRAAKIINKFGSPNCYLVSLGLLSSRPWILSNLIFYYKLPACLSHAGNFPFMSQLAELVTAKAELAHVATGPSGELATAA